MLATIYQTARYHNQEDSNYRNYRSFIVDLTKDFFVSSGGWVIFLLLDFISNVLLVCDDTKKTVAITRLLRGQHESTGKQVGPLGQQYLMESQFAYIYSLFLCFLA
jgi:hypothetical protein